MNANLYVIEDYENEPPSGPKKTNPNKSNFKCQISVFCFLSSVIRPLSSVFGPLFSGEAQFIEFSPQKKFDSWHQFGKIPLFV